MNPEWIDYKEAAEMMHRPAAYLRARDAGGGYLYFPSIERWQPGGKRTKLFVRRDHVDAWIESTKTPVEAKPQFSGIGYESALPTLKRLKATRTMRALGLK